MAIQKIVRMHDTTLLSYFNTLDLCLIIFRALLNADTGFGGSPIAHFECPKFILPFQYFGGVT